MLQEQQPETEQRGGEGSGDPWPEQAQGQVGQKRIREEAEVTAMNKEGRSRHRRDKEKKHGQNTTDRRGAGRRASQEG